MSSNIKNSDNELFGHERRSSQRKKQRQEAIEQCKILCETLWQTFCVQNTQENISDDDINQLYDDILEQLKKCVPTKFIPFALFERKRFFEKINQKRKTLNLPPFPEPVIASRVSRPKNINDLDSFLYLSQAQEVANNAIDTWCQKNKFSLLDSISWFLFSLVSFAGYSDDKILKAIYEYMAEDKPVYQLFDDMLCLPIKIESPFYANEIKILNDSLQQLYITRLVIIDDISRLWLYKIQHQTGSDSFPKYHQVIKRLGEFTGEGFTVKSIHKSEYLKHNSVYWQTLPKVRLDIQLVQVLLGNQNQTSITQEQLLRYFQKIKQPKAVLSNNDIEKLTIESKDELRSTDDNSQQFKSDIVKDVRSILNSDAKKIRAKLEQLLTEPLFPNQIRLVTWIIDLHTTGNKISTLKRYLSDIGNDFIASTRDTDFFGWSKHNYHFIYDEILANKNQNRIGYTTTVICSLHSSLKRHFKAPDIDLRGGGDPQIVSSYLIPYQVYQVLQSSISNQHGISDYYKQLLNIVVTLLYRTGMRISEILGLQVKDIEYDNQSFSEYNIIVRSNPYRSLKSDDGTRRIYLSVLLLDDELEQFKKFLNSRRTQNINYLFTYQYQSKILSRHSIEQPIKKILADTIYRDITLHAFRHNAISNMAVILRSDYNIAKYFIDYNENQLTTIRQHFLGKVRKVSTNYWDALMEFAGHADLNTTFSSYIHTADIIASYQLQQANLTLPSHIVYKLINTNRNKLYQHNKLAVDAKENTVDLSQIRHYINRKIKLEQLSTTITICNKVNKDSHDSNTSSNNQKVSAVFGIYNREVIEKLLHDIEDGQPVSEASSLNFNYDDALRLYERALNLVTDSKGNLNHKLISKDRKQKSEHILIAPTPLHYREDNALLQLCFDNLETLYADPSSRRDVKDMLKVFYDKVNTSKSEIRFPFKEKQLFYKYLKVMCRILPSHYWRINVCSIRYKSQNNEKKKRTMSSLVDSEDTLNKTEDLKANYPDFRGTITTDDNYNGYALSVISPVKSKKNQSSALMKYVLHFLLIVEGLSG
ncbi:site-specific integrase [Psychrobacter phenylpyruvicus]|uniref:Site-specific tyrosine recombinase XerC n=1 Tax=Psychrobacter phenylpyruvicus TaxID=29432 RepID=A0A379LMK3_9GAMM|nr:site-specific integrase [Psychrobacter phenylpyruvicus]SUD91829.1 site-specific tyrosine recombinase XerC [Psychrobacter phenylpyruvicus]